MNRLHANDRNRRARIITQILGEEWVWDGLLAVIVTFGIAYTVLSPGTGPIV
jgi:hypothetical protein